MATWIAHMRVAEHFMKTNARLNNERFLVGNIGPDCGVPNADWSRFTPDKSVTHWLAADGKTIDAEDFRTRYLDPRSELYPFYLGYYFHLLTDIEWSAFWQGKMQDPICIDGFARDENFIWTVKKDWYGHDHLFLRDNPDFVFYTIFVGIDAFPNDYFDFYPENAFTDRIKYITNFYLTSHEDPYRDFPYLSKAELDGFVRETINIIENAHPVI